MTKKRLDRDLKWGFQGFPYYQMRIDMEGFHGLVSLIELADGDYYYWNLPKAGKVPVCGKGMTWLQLIPDNTHRVITAKFLPKGKVIDGIDYEESVSVWYVDVIEEFGYDQDGVLYFYDKYLDVIFDPEGDVILDDKDELEAAYESGDLTKEQYEAALNEGDLIQVELCQDITSTEILCQDILAEVKRQIEVNPDVFKKNI